MFTGIDDFSAKTHRRDAGHAESQENEPRWMHDGTYVCVTRYGSRCCERCGSAVKYPFCSGLIIFKDHINAIVHHIYARGLLLCVRSAFRGEATAGAQRGAARRLRLSAPLHNRSSEYGIVHSFRIHAVISIVGREEPEERGIWLCPPFRGGLS